jgi:5-methylcytosine-specific restriction endonuclease McrA
MPRPSTVCSVSGCPNRAVDRGRCAEHKRADTRGTRTQQGYDNRWLRIAAEAIRQQPWCSVCGATTDLTGDHIMQLSKGGENSAENCRVLCRRCNSRRGNRG